MNILGIIPARYNSSRFPGKPLVEIDGKTMIQRVYEQAKKSDLLSDVCVATDDERIHRHVLDFGGKSYFTSPNHESGTDRCAEIAAKLDGFDVIINIQGDEPYIDPAQINLLCNCFQDETAEIATLIKKISSDEELNNPNTPKVVISNSKVAAYFSRTPIPYLRGVEPSKWLDQQTFFKHIGIYGYRSEILQKITTLAVSSLEKAEALEQLRWIENGYTIKVAITDIETIAVDTPQDLEKLKHLKR